MVIFKDNKFLCISQKSVPDFVIFIIYTQNFATKNFH